MRETPSPKPIRPDQGSPSLNRTRYVWDANVAGIDRCAIIDAPKPTAVTRPGVVIFFHGRGGSAVGTEALLNLASRIPEVVVAYGEGIIFDSTGKRGWEIRFPHVYYRCNKGKKDFAYVNALLDQLAQEHDIDKSRVFIAGHSNGGFFSLSLAELMADRLRGVVAIGAYTSYAPAPTEIDCSNSYSDGISGIPLKTRMTILDTLNKSIKRNPVDILLVFGRQEKTIKGNYTWVSRCDIFSYLRHSIIQLTLKNGSQAPVCSRTSNFMLRLDRQVFPSLDSTAADTQIQIYDGDHSLSPIAKDAAQWIVDFFRVRL